MVHPTYLSNQVFSGRHFSFNAPMLFNSASEWDMLQIDRIHFINVYLNPAFLMSHTRPTSAIQRLYACEHAFSEYKFHFLLLLWNLLAYACRYHKRILLQKTLSYQLPSRFSFIRLSSSSISSLYSLLLEILTIAVSWSFLCVLKKISYYNI